MCGQKSVCTSYKRLIVTFFKDPNKTGRPPRPRQDQRRKKVRTTLHTYIDLYQARSH
jgi:hypothetical protein